MTTLNLQVGANNDDAHETDAGTSFSASATEVYLDSSTVNTSRWNGGMRFTGVTIANAATINTATLDVYVTSASYDDANLDIHAEDEDNAVDFAATADVTSRTRTAASTAWVEEPLGLGWHTSPDFAAVIKEVVDRVGWASGNALVVLGDAKADTANALGIHSHDRATGFAAKLDIDYTVAGGVTVTPPTLALSLALFAPTVSTPRLVTPSTLALVLAEFAPSVEVGVVVTPGVVALSTSPFAPTILLPVLVTPTTTALLLTEFAPTVTVGGAIVVTPSTLALTMTFFAPTLGAYTAYGAPFLYTEANWGTSLAFYLEVYLKAATGTARARLWNDTDGAVVADSGLSTAETSYTRLRSGALSLVDGKTYVVQFGTEDGTAGEFKHGKVVVF